MRKLCSKTACMNSKIFFCIWNINSKTRVTPKIEPRWRHLDRLWRHSKIGNFQNSRIIKGVTRYLLVISQNWPKFVFKLNRPWWIQWCLYFCASMCGLEVTGVAQHTRAPSLSAVFYLIEKFYLIIFIKMAFIRLVRPFFILCFLYFLVLVMFSSDENNANCRSRWTIFPQLQCLTNAVGVLCWGHGTIIRIQQPMKNANNQFQTFFRTQKHKFENKRNMKIHAIEDTER